MNGQYIVEAQTVHGELLAAAGQPLEFVQVGGPSGTYFRSVSDPSKFLGVSNMVDGYNLDFEGPQDNTFRIEASSPGVSIYSEHHHRDLRLAENRVRFRNDVPPSDAKAQWLIEDAP